MKFLIILAVGFAAVFATVSAQEECTSEEFTCDNGLCVPASYECDSEVDCWDYSDELDCPCDGGFVCNSTGICIPGDYQCDYYDDCEDGSDEVGCVCNGFTCDNDKCIIGSYQCDGYDDCGDNSDEVGCPSTTTTTPGPCFDCLDGSDCVPEDYRCDDWVDCNDGSDESDCPCEDDETKCDNGQCVSTGFWCDSDGIWDCLDGSDQNNCPNATRSAGVHRMGMAKVFRLAKEGKIIKSKYQQKLRTLKNKKLGNY